MSHRILDARSIAMHRLAVEKIRQQPQLMACVANNLSRWRGCVSARTMPYIVAEHVLVQVRKPHLVMRDRAQICSWYPAAAGVDFDD